MKTYEDECIGCPKEIGCFGMACKNKNVPHYYCDECKQEFEPEELYVTDEGDLCDECILNNYETVAQQEEREGL